VVLFILAAPNFGTISTAMAIKGSILLTMFFMFAELSGLREKSWNIWLSFPQKVHIGICILTTFTYFKFIQKPFDVAIEASNGKK